MSVELTREGWLPMFSDQRDPNMFLSRFFTQKPGGIYNGDKVAIDVRRGGEQVAIAIKKHTGPNLNDFDLFDTKEFTPPAYGEAFPLNVNDLIQRMAGVDPYSAAYQEYGGALVSEMARGFVLIDNKIKRGVELQASQVLQTGVITLTDASGVVVFSVDYKPKATHFPTVGTPWSGAADPLADLLSLCNLIRADGKVTPNMCIMGQTALTEFLATTGIQNNLDNRREFLGEIRPELADSGAVFYGHVWTGSYRLEIWTYPETFEDPATGNATRYIDDGKVVVLSDQTRLDRVSARVPLPIGPDPRVAHLLPGRMASIGAAPGDQFDVTPNVYTTENGKQVMGELESRPLMIPVQIDGFGCLTT